MAITKQSVLSNFIWKFAERCGNQLVQLLVSIVLARLLAPEAYGTISLVLVFANILQVFVDSGLGNALIQKKDADDLDFSSVFFFNLAMCLVLYTILFFCAPLIALFYEDASLTSITRVLCLTVVISGLKNVQQAYVSRTMQFRKFFFATLIGTTLSAVAGIGLAFYGFGVWALVAQRLVTICVDTIVLWMIVKWHPKLMFSWNRLKGLSSFGWKLLVSALLDVGYNNLRSLIIGKLYTEADLGYYNQGNQFPHVIVTNINASIDSILLPVMSREQEHKEQVKNMTRRAIKTSVYLMAPLMMGLAFTAEQVVSVVLTDKWLPCVPFLIIFCITYMFYPIHTANLNAMKAMGRSDLFLKLEIIKNVIGMILLLSSMWFGVMAIAYSLLVSSVCSQIVNAWPNRKLLNYSYFDQLKDILPSILLAVVMGVCVKCLAWLPLPTIIVLFLQVMIGVGIYVVGSIMTKNDSFYYLWDIVKKFLAKKGVAK